ncbi:MAG: AMIN domain-containing protein [Gemmatimonadaceae bacterium]|nr:AMIN domain-containing protein [Gemmatimonadaceae bacterium]
MTLACLVAFFAASTASAGAAPALEVRSISVVQGAAGPEVVIAVDDGVEVEDFTLESPHRIVIDFKGALLSIPANFYDKVNRAGITNIRAAQYAPGTVRIVVETDAARPHRLSRKTNELRVAITGTMVAFEPWYSAGARERAAAAAEPPAERALQLATSPQQSTQPRITVAYQDADIRDVIAAFASFSGRTIVIGKDVAGTITAEIRNQPWDVALRAILQGQGLAASEDAQSGIITVDSYKNIASKQSSEPMTTQLIPINYANAGALVGTVKALLSRECTPGGVPEAAQNAQTSCFSRGSVAVDTATNTLVITESPTRLAELLGFIRSLDVRTPQVAIKAKIIFVNRTDIEELGLTYDVGTGTDQFFSRLVQRTDPTTTRPVDTNGDGVPDALGGGTAFQGDRILLGGNALSAIANANARVTNPALSLVFSTALGRFQLTSFLDALQEVRLADLQAEPSIVTLDNRRAEILVGQEIPIRVIDASGGGAAGTGQVPRATVQLKEVGIILSVTPHITNNRQVLLTVHAENSDAQLASSDVGFIFGKQRADNQLLVADGETAVIGGLTVTQVTQSKSGIPLLVDLPFIGRLFGVTRTSQEKRDLLILVTPHIVDEGDRARARQ